MLKNVSRILAPALAVFALCLLVNCTDANSAAVTAAALSTPTADECAFVTHEALADVRAPVDQAIALSDIDKAQNGVTGAYASAANTANDYLRAARAKIVEMDDYMTQNGTVIYSMGPWYSIPSADAWKQLDSGTWWLQVSAGWHRSVEARQAIEWTGDAMERLDGVRVRAIPRVATSGSSQRTRRIAFHRTLGDLLEVAVDVHKDRRLNLAGRHPAGVRESSQARRNSANELV